MNYIPHSERRPRRVRHVKHYTVPPPRSVLIEKREGMIRLVDAICHPERVEGWEEGSDTATETQLKDAGYGSAGPL